ncbi:MAG: hypothetical protein AAGA93_25365 [Actinomycetota bacterium]
MTAVVDRLGRWWAAGRRTEVGVREGWSLAAVALVTGLAATVLTTQWSVTAGWLATRLAIGGALALAFGLLAGSNGLIGLAALPALAGPTIGLDRPEGHAWGQVLLIGLLWYLATELAWASVDTRGDTRRSPAVNRLRIREVATVVAVAVAVGVAGTLLASAAPVRTAVVRALAVAAILAGVVALGRSLGRRTGNRPSDRA